MYRYIVVCLIFLLTTSCGGEKETPDAEVKPYVTSTDNTVSLTADQVKNVGIETGQPLLKSISEELILQGKVDVMPQGKVSVSFPLGGFVKISRLLPGMNVKKGQVLAELEDMQLIELQQDYLMAKEKFILTESEYIRQRDLNASKASSDKVFQQARSERETQWILMNALRQKLSVIGINPDDLKPENITNSVEILSPVNGFVSKVNVNAGKYTAPTDILFELIDPQKIYLVLNVFEKDLNSLSIGQRVTAFTNSDPEKLLPAKIVQISKSLNEDRMAEVHCQFENYNATMLPGLFMNGRVSITSKKALTVAEGAVVRWENKHYVFSETGVGQYKMDEVVLGSANEGWQQITSPSINSSTRLVNKNAYSLLMKIKNSEEE